MSDPTAADRRSKERRSGKNRRENIAWATEVLRETHLRIIDLLESLEDHMDGARLGSIRDQLMDETRIHRALVEEILLPAIREAAKDPEALSELEQELRKWEPLREAVERLPVEDPGFPAAWQQLADTITQHIEAGDHGLARTAQSLPLDFVAIGLRMIELRRRFLAEKPAATWEVAEDLSGD